MTPAPARGGEIARGLGALIVLLTLLAGLPAGLAVVGGSPVPHGVPSWEQITATLMRPDTGNTVFLASVKLIGWAAWCLFTLITLIETAGYLRGRPARRLPRPLAPMQHLARDLIAMTALLITTSAPMAGTATAPHHVTSATAQPQRPAGPVGSSAQTDATSPQTAFVLVSQPVTARPAPQRWHTRIIKRGDTLWAIARQEYGSGTRYLRIFHASTHLRQPHGLPRLTDPNRIYPGQNVRVPDTRRTADRRRPPAPPGHATHRPDDALPAAPTAPPRTASPSTPDTTRPATRPQGSTPTTTRASAPPASASAPSPSATPPPASPTTWPGSGGDTATPARPLRSTPPHARPAPSPAADEPRHGAPVAVTLPTGTTIGLGLATAISTALAATRLHRRRRRADITEWPAPTSTNEPPAPPRAVATARKAHLDTRAARGEPIPSDADLVADDITTPPPAHISVGVRDGHDLTLDLAGLNVGGDRPGRSRGRPRDRDRTAGKTAPTASSSSSPNRTRPSCSPAPESTPQNWPPSCPAWS